ncbi:Tubulin-specific chaperone E [Nosema granulosis]|uniref:Tubulin-specific chaperone E n=1 Tax=Nosema granulosis TaxID=83296 RepID=A0A9P6GYN3_9MICR|nr:Tubulin-specific chaperone E [Nosema granulosis]
MSMVGERIKTKEGMIATIKYIGNIDDKEGLWVGLELDSPKGKHNGSLNGKMYFECPDKHGIFVRYEKLNSMLNTPMENTPMKNSLKETPIKDNSILFRDCTIKVDDIKNGTNNNVENVIQDNFYLSKINEYSKQLAKLKKILKSQEQEIKDLKEKHEQESKFLRNKLEKEIQRTKEANKKLSNTKKDFLHQISSFKREAMTNYTEINNLLKDLALEPSKVSDREHVEICSAFGAMLKSFIDGDHCQLEENISTVTKIFKSNGLI